jgi:hypothetical protein
LYIKAIATLLQQLVHAFGEVISKTVKIHNVPYFHVNIGKRKKKKKKKNVNFYLFLNLRNFFIERGFWKIFPLQNWLFQF